MLITKNAKNQYSVQGKIRRMFFTIYYQLAKEKKIFCDKFILKKLKNTFFDKYALMKLFFFYLFNSEIFQLLDDNCPMSSFEILMNKKVNLFHIS